MSDGFNIDAETDAPLTALLADLWSVATVRDADTGVYTLTLTREGVSYSGEAESFIGAFEAAYDEYDAGEYVDPSCAACGASVGIFPGYGEGWHHYRGDGTVSSPIELYSADHKPSPAWT